MVVSIPVCQLYMPAISYRGPIPEKLREQIIEEIKERGQDKPVRALQVGPQMYVAADGRRRAEACSVLGRPILVEVVEKL